MRRGRGRSSIARSVNRYSVAMTQALEAELRTHLLRTDGQEDLCLALYQPSNGTMRLTALLTDIVYPQPGETRLHGNVSFTGDYVLRATLRAVACGGGIAVLHSHPGGSGWQGLSTYDKEAEGSYANLVREITGQPLVGMTLAGRSGTWSARFWNVGVGLEIASNPCESVRVVGERLTLSWNPDLRPAPETQTAMTRAISCWGSSAQADLARLRILVVGAGTIGLDVALRLAATGVCTLGILDYDSVKLINLDRLIGVSAIDVLLRRSKVEVATRLLRQNAVARLKVVPMEGSVCEPALFSRVLDYDLVFCCIDDRPWPRSVLNVIPYSDLIPVIDGGIQIDSFSDGKGMRNATWRSHVLRPGRPCMACNGQLDLGRVHVDREGLLDEPSYISGLPYSERPQNQNVAALAVSASASLLAQFVSFVVTPAGLGEPGPLRYSLSTHWLERVDAATRKHCPVEQGILAGNQRQVVLDQHVAAREEVRERRRGASAFPVRIGRVVDSTTAKLSLLASTVVRRIATGGERPPQSDGPERCEQEICEIDDSLTN